VKHVRRNLSYYLLHYISQGNGLLTLDKISLKSLQMTRRLRALEIEVLKRGQMEVPAHSECLVHADQVIEGASGIYALRTMEHNC